MAFGGVDHIAGVGELRSPGHFELLNREDGFGILHKVSH